MAVMQRLFNSSEIGKKSYSTELTFTISWLWLSTTFVTTRELPSALAFNHMPHGQPDLYVLQQKQNTTQHKNTKYIFIRRLQISVPYHLEGTVIISYSDELTVHVTLL